MLSSHDDTVDPLLGDLGCTAVYFLSQYRGSLNASTVRYTTHVQHPLFWLRLASYSPPIQQKCFNPVFLFAKGCM